MNPLYRIPIRLQILLIVAIVALPAAGIVAYSGVQHRKDAIERARGETRSLVEMVDSKQKLLVASAQQLLVTLAQLPEINEKDTVATSQFLGRILELHPNIGNIFVADRTGTIWASANPFANKITIRDRRYFKNAMASGRLSSGEYQIGRISHRPTLNLGYPYRDHQGKAAGVIGVSMSLEKYAAGFQQFQQDGANLVLTDHKGTVLFETGDVAQTGKAFDQARFKRMQEGPDADTSTDAGSAGNAPEQACYVSYRKLRLLGESSPYLYVWVGIPVASALSEATEDLVRSMSLFALVLVSALILAWIIGKRSISDRIGLLVSASRNVASGDLQVRVSDWVKGGELGRLAESFDTMAGELHGRERVLAEKQQQLEDLNLNLEQRVASAVSDLRKKDQILILQGRQAAMGEMIGNIAHQWRQPLNTLGLVVQEIWITYARDEATKESVETGTRKAMTLINHMSKTINDFSSYFRPEHDKSLFSATDAVSKTLSLLEPTMKSLQIDIRYFPVQPSEVYGYANEYAQVLLNILINCKDAFQERNGETPRVITITATKENDRSVVTVADNAGGIPAHILDKIFDPYFTTKGPDSGTGIGLYMAKTIVEQHMDGRLTARNVDGGAEFRIEV